MESPINSLKGVSILTRPIPPTCPSLLLKTRIACRISPGVPSSMTARIFKPAKNAMQSGRAKTKEWQLDFEPEQPRTVEPLMGWTSSTDMKPQLTLDSESTKEAPAYCERKRNAYKVIEPKDSAHREIAYADN